MTHACAIVFSTFQMATYGWLTGSIIWDNINESTTIQCNNIYIYIDLNAYAFDPKHGQKIYGFPLLSFMALMCVCASQLVCDSQPGRP